MHAALYNYKETHDSPYDTAKLTIHFLLRPEIDLTSNFANNSQKTVSFDHMVHIIDEQNIVTKVDFDCGATFCREAITKNGQINRQRKHISRPCEKSECIPINDQHKCSMDKEHTSLIFLNPCNLWDMDPAAVMPLKHTTDRDSMSNQNFQTTTRQPRTDSYPVFSSLRLMESKKKGLQVSFAHFQMKYLPGGRVTAKVATVEELKDLWKLGAMDGAPPFVMNYSCVQVWLLVLVV